MSTQIASIKTIGDELRLVQFHTKRHGLCLAIDAYDLSKSQVQQLVRELQNWLGETELPWKENSREFADLLEQVLFETVDAPVYPDGPCLVKGTRDDIKAALQKAKIL